MKIKKINKEVLQDIKDMAEALPDIWKGYQVTKPHTGQFCMECNIHIPIKMRNALGYVNKNDIYDITYDRYQILDHEAAMLKLVKKAKTADKAKEQILWYVGKYTKIAKVNDCLLLSCNYLILLNKNRISRFKLFT